MKKTEINALIIAADFTASLARTSPNTIAAFGLTRAHINAIEEVGKELKRRKKSGQIVKIPTWTDPLPNPPRFDENIPF
jgi:hypothetical protein